MSRTGEKLRDRLGVTALSPEQVRETARRCGRRARNRPASTPRGSRGCAPSIRPARSGAPAAGRRGRPRLGGDPLGAVAGVVDLGYDAQRGGGGQQGARAGAGRCRARSGSPSRAASTRRASNGTRRAETYRSLWTFYPGRHRVRPAARREPDLRAGATPRRLPRSPTLRKLPPPAGQDPRIDIAEARNASRLSDIAAELRASRAAEEKGRRSGQSLVVAQALIYEGDALIRMGKPQEAVRLFRESAELGARKPATNGDTARRWRTSASPCRRSATSTAPRRSTRGARHRPEARQRHRHRVAVPPPWARCTRTAASWPRRCRTSTGDRLVRADRRPGDGDADAQHRHRRAGLPRGSRRGPAAVRAGAGAQPGARRSMPTRRSRSPTWGPCWRRRGTSPAPGAATRRRSSLLHQAGDASSAAAALAASASAAAKLGDLRTAWQRSAQALAAKQQAGDRIGVGRILGLRARRRLPARRPRRLAVDRRRAAPDRPRHRRAIAHRRWRSQNRGRADFAAGDLAAARAELTEALRVSSSPARGAAGDGDPPRSRRPRPRRGPGRRGRRPGAPGGRLVSRPWYRRRRGDGAVDPRRGAAAPGAAPGGAGGGGARARPPRDQRGPRAPPHRRRPAGADRRRHGDPGEALRQLRRAVEEAAGLGFVTAGLEARLALGEVQRGAGDPAAAPPSPPCARRRRPAASSGWRWPRLPPMAAAVAQRAPRCRSPRPDSGTAPDGAMVLGLALGDPLLLPATADDAKPGDAVGCRESKLRPLRLWQAEAFLYGAMIPMKLSKSLIAAGAVLAFALVLSPRLVAGAKAESKTAAAPADAPRAP